MTSLGQVRTLLKTKTHINVNLGAADSPMTGFINVDMQDLPGVDVVWDLEKFPWPFPDSCVDLLIASQLVEHIEPHGGIFIRFMDEAWRILKPKGQFMIATPYAGSAGYYQDPTHCLLDGAEVLTQDGFKDFKQVSINENILTLKLEDGKTEFSKCTKLINRPYNGKILHFNNRAIDIAVTPNHDLVWKTWQPIKGYHKSTAETFKQIGAFARRGLKTIKDWKGKDTVSGDLMELIGWILSEGGFIKRGNYKRISIHQSSKVNHENYQRIENLLKKLNLVYQKYERRIDFKDDQLFEELLGKSGTKRIPAQYKNQKVELLLRILESLMLGDGEQHPHGSGNTYTTISYQLAKDVSEVAVKCGLNAVIRTRKGKEFVAPNGKVYTRKDQFRVSVTYDNPMLYPQPKVEQYQGIIVCVQVEKNNTILTRYNGHIAWIGNCNPCNELTFAYFDPLDAVTKGLLYQNYKPKPWHIMENSWYSNGNLEVLLEKRPDDPIYHKSTAEGQNVVRKEGLKFYG